MVFKISEKNKLYLATLVTIIVSGILLDGIYDHPVLDLITKYGLFIAVPSSAILLFNEFMHTKSRRGSILTLLLGFICIGIAVLIGTYSDYILLATPFAILGIVLIIGAD